MEVSIIIHVYKKVRYLQTILHQIQKQSFQNFQCILIDDGSTDGSEQICDNFAEEDHRFMVIHIPNGGVSHARNVGLAQAKGEYITFIDADDTIQEDYLSNLVNCVKTSGADMVISGLTKCWENNDKTEKIIPAHLGTMTLDAIMPDFARVQRYTGIYGFVCSKLIKSELIKNVRFNEKITLAEDLDFFLSLYDYVHLIHFDSGSYYYYTQAAQNSSMLDSGWGIDYFTQLQIQKKIADLITRRGFMYGENEKVMNQRLYDYVFFCMFYAPIPKLKSICGEIRALGLPIRQKRTGDSIIRTLLLTCYVHKWDSLASVLLSAYRMLRSVIKKLR